jgi:vitamin B12 transporter
MKTTLRKNIIKISLLISIIITNSLPCFGQSDEEMQALRLFYDDKDLVVTATRSPKPITQVAENITVITSDEIAAMNAHTVVEVFNRVPGLFVSSNRDFGANAVFSMQGSESRHTLVLVDDVPWNFVNEGAADTITVPVGIIERIEIIKGPASSAWGSSLGGVINIITKSVEENKTASGSVQASYGKNNSQDYRADLSGTAGKAGYYLYAGLLNSDGLVRSRFTDNVNLFSKLNIPVSDRINTGIRIGYSDSDTGFGDYSSADININGSTRSVSISPYLNAKISSELAINLSAFYLNQDSGQLSNALGLGMVGEQGELYYGMTIKEKVWGGKGQIVWKKSFNTVVLGVDIEKNGYDHIINTGTFLQAIGAPPVSAYYPDNTKWAFYANDTIAFNKWSITPGIRYDHKRVTDSFVSPSLGLTFMLTNDTVLRGTIARGFSDPPLSITSGGGLFLDPNPSLKPEKIWSYQAGLESAFSFMWLRLNLFLHDVKDNIDGVFQGGGPPAYNDININGGKVRQKGFEIEAETTPIYNFSIRGGLSYTNLNDTDSSGSTEMYTGLIAIKYDYNQLSGQLIGNNIHYDDNAPGKSYDFIWDLNINKEYHIDNSTDVELFAVMHNIFNGFQYSFIEHRNPNRWLEAGIKYKF